MACVYGIVHGMHTCPPTVTHMRTQGCGLVEWRVWSLILVAMVSVGELALRWRPSLLVLPGCESWEPWRGTRLSPGHVPVPFGPVHSAVTPSYTLKKGSSKQVSATRL
jgi:hypothetical protein